MSEYGYCGGELDLFAQCRNWKAYWSAQIRPYIRGEVLEVGAGIGANTAFLNQGGRHSWVCLEPDAHLLAQLRVSLAQSGIDPLPEAICGTLESLDASRRFDTLIYIDVLEHIENDRLELANASTRLRPGGRIIVLSPAHQAMFSRFDAAIGHWRRYNRRTLSAAAPPGLRLERMWYLDCTGLLLVAGNRLTGNRSTPTPRQLWIWDRLAIPLSRVLDRLFFHSLGKTIVAVWQLDAARSG